MFDGSSSSSFDGILLFRLTEVLLHLTEVLRLTEVLLLLRSTEAAPLRGYRSRQRLSGYET